MSPSLSPLVPLDLVGLRQQLSRWKRKARNTKVEKGRGTLLQVSILKPAQTWRTEGERRSRFNRKFKVLSIMQDWTDFPFSASGQCLSFSDHRSSAT